MNTSQLIVTGSIFCSEFPERGSLINKYQPLNNLVAPNRTIGKFTTEELNFDKSHPVDIQFQDSYDGSVNLLLVDDKNPPRLINSRFSVQDNNSYLIPDHYGFKDSNLYDSKTFDTDTRIKVIYSAIPNLKYEGLQNGAGKLKCGSYSFCFKYSDVDGNETDVCQESGIVQVHIGEISDPSSARMGMEDELSGKTVKFTLSNIDTGFDYVHVIFARSSSGVDQTAVTTYHKINFNYPIYNGVCQISINGNEQIIDISESEFYDSLLTVDSVKTQAISNNVLLYGNVSKQERDWEALKQMSWRIIPSPLYDSTLNLGSIDCESCKDLRYSGNNYSNNYYNTQNVYNYVGYWPDEIYRFGIVYIFDDNSLSPVFNIQGVDFSKYSEGDEDWWKNFFDGDYAYEYEPGNSELESDEIASNKGNDSYFFNKKLLTNSRGVIHFSKVHNTNTNEPDTRPYNLQYKTLTSKPIGIKFDFNYIGYTNLKDRSTKISTEEIFKKHHIMGYFFVRQKRVPTIIAQGMVIGLTDKLRGALPVLKKRNTDTNYLTQSFIDSGRMLVDEGTFVKVSSENVKRNAILIPDAEMYEPMFNDLFVSNEYFVESIGQIKLDSSTNKHIIATQLNDRFTPTSSVCKVTNVPEDSSTLTDGTKYFATRAGNLAEAYKTEDVAKAWRWSLPQDLTTSTTVVRGIWGSYVGINSDKFEYGQIVNIKKKHFEHEQEALIAEFEQRFTDLSPYFSICHRQNIGSKTISCYRGDCFTTLFTHRMYHNFQDAELPTNTKIIDPSCWAKNYGVRCTAVPGVSSFYNVTDSAQEGWNLEENLADKTSNVQAMSLDEVNSAAKKALNAKYPWTVNVFPNGLANEVVTSFSVDTKDGEKKHVVEPKEQEKASIGTAIKSIFSSDSALYGIASINRADVNAVGLGQWVTFPICSNTNYSFRDIDFSNTVEESKFNKKRSFYPLSAMDSHLPLRDSTTINGAAKITVPVKKYYRFADVVYLKQEYFNRVYWSPRDSSKSFTNEFKHMLETCFVDYNKELGTITKLVAIPEGVLVVFVHGLGIFQIQNTNEVKQLLPQQLTILSKDYGSTWGDSVISTSRGINNDFSVYGVDSIAKKIWRYNSKGVQLISDHKVSKFLNDNIKMSQYESVPTIGAVNIKTHYNAFKHDVIFTYYNGHNTITGDKLPMSMMDEAVSGYIRRIGEKWYLDDRPIALDQLNLQTTADEITGGSVEGLILLLRQLKVDKEGYLLLNDKEVWEESGRWSICYNEDLDIFTTFYDWIPLMSANVDNTMVSFDKDADVSKNGSDEDGRRLWKHGFTSLFGDTGGIKPTNWYDRQHEFNFEFAVNNAPSVQKIFNSLKIISNKAEPYKFEFEVVGEAYDWYKYKTIVDYIHTHYNDLYLAYNHISANDSEEDKLKKAYAYVLKNQPKECSLFTGTVSKLPYIPLKNFKLPGTNYSTRTENRIYKFPVNRQQDSPTNKYTENTSETMLVKDSQLNEYRVRTEQLGIDVRKFGRLRGNMHYLEDLWDVEIRPLTIKWAYLDNSEQLIISKPKEARLRDKYVKVKIRYTGEDLAVISAIQTMFDYSFA